MKRTVFYCGMHSHSSAVLNGQAEYLREISHEACKNIHATGVYQLESNILINKLLINETTSRSITLGGNIYINGDCSGIQYSDPYGTWKNVVVQGIVKITLIEQTAVVDLTTDTIHLNSGIVCPLSQSKCIEQSGGGYTFWDPLPIEICHFNKYQLLYEGLASKLYYKTDETLLSLVTDDIIFVLRQTDQISICNYILYKTEHPKLFLFETKPERNFLTSKNLTVESMDMMTYANSKFIYVERHIRTEINSLYRDVRFQRCRLEQEVIKIH